MQYDPALRTFGGAREREDQPIATDRHLAELGDLCGDFALQCSDVAGFVNRLHQRIAGDNQRLEQLQPSVAGPTALRKWGVYGLGYLI